METIKKKRNNDRVVRVEGVDYQAEVILSAANEQIQIKEYQGGNLSGLKRRLISIARDEGYSKISVKSYSQDRIKFKYLNFKVEATIDSFYPDSEAVLMAYYLTKDRRTRNNKLEKEKKLAKIRTLGNKLITNLSKEYEYKLIEEGDLSQLARLYDQVFESYYNPINEEEYLKKTLDDDVVYAGIYYKDELVAAGSAKKIPKYKTAEMNNFATVPEYSGRGLAAYLLYEFETKLREEEYNCLYTIARAGIFGINKIFSQVGYHYTGTLIKNYNIEGRLEDMNVWCKVIG